MKQQPKLCLVSSLPHKNPKPHISLLRHHEDSVLGSPTILPPKNYHWQAHQRTLSPGYFVSEEQTCCLSEHVLFQVDAPNLKRTVQSHTVKRSWALCSERVHLATCTTAFVLESVSCFPC